MMQGLPTGNEPPQQLFCAKCKSPHFEQIFLLAYQKTMVIGQGILHSKVVLYRCIKCQSFIDPQNLFGAKGKGNTLIDLPISAKADANDKEN